MAHQKVYSMQVRGALLLKVFIVYAAFWILISLMLTVISVRLWNFKDGGSQKVRFLAKNQHSPKENILKDPYGECQFIKK